MDEFNDERIGDRLQVLCEGFDRLAECWYGRSYADSPDIDGKVFFTGQGIAGRFVTVRITDVLDGDLLGEVID